MNSSAQARESRAGIIAVAVAAVLWGTVGIATQAIYHRSDLSAVAVGFFRLATATPLVAVVGWKTVGRQQLRESRRQIWKVLLIGVMLALYQVLFFAAIGQVGVAVATLITLCTAPVLVAVLSGVILRERLAGYTLAALAAAIVGTVLLVGVPATGEMPGEVAVGAALALGSAAGYAIVALLGRAIADSCHPVLSTTISFAAGATFLFPLAAGNVVATAYTLPVWGLLLYVGLLPTAVAYTLFFFGMRGVRATTASILTMLEPLTATVLAWLVFGERLAPSGFAGALLLVAAMTVVWLGERGTVRP